MTEREKSKAISTAPSESNRFQLLAFGIARDIVGGSQTFLTLEGTPTVGALKAALQQQYPDFGRLKSLAIAVNAEYREDDFRLNQEDEIVIIPPVSGG